MASVSLPTGIMGEQSFSMARLVQMVLEVSLCAGISHLLQLFWRDNRCELF